MSELSVCDVHLCTCARARTHTYTQTDRHSLAQMPHRRSPSQTRTLSLCCCQIKAWKAGHKGDCVAAARADTRTAAKPTAGQMRVLEILKQLYGAADWRGVAAQERVPRAVAAAVRTSMPSIASGVYSILGIAYYSLGQHSWQLHTTIASSRRTSSVKETFITNHTLKHLS